MRPVLLLAAALTLPVGAQAAAPRLILVDESPVEVAGTGFHHGEKVTVRVSASSGSTFARTVVASSSGRIDVRFSQRSLAPCDAVALSAVGSAGSHVTRKIPIPPACGIVLDP